MVSAATPIRDRPVRLRPGDVGTSREQSCPCRAIQHVCSDFSGSYQRGLPPVSRMSAEAPSLTLQWEVGHAAYYRPRQDYSFGSHGYWLPQGAEYQQPAPQPYQQPPLHTTAKAPPVPIPVGREEWGVLTPAALARQLRIPTEVMQQAMATVAEGAPCAQPAAAAATSGGSEPPPLARGSSHAPQTATPIQSPSSAPPPGVRPAASDQPRLTSSHLRQHETAESSQEQQQQRGRWGSWSHGWGRQRQGSSHAPSDAQSSGRSAG